VILPGWDSIAALTKTHRFFEIGGIVCLGLLVLFEAFTYVYGRRLEVLSATAQKQILDDALGRQSDQLKSEYGHEMEVIRGQADSLAKELSAKKQLEEEAERVRRTPPKIMVGLEPVGKGKVNISFVSQNLIPFEYRYDICTKDSVIVAGVPLAMSKVYPRTDHATFSIPVDIQLDRVKDNYLEFHFRFQSLSYDELHLAGHAGQITVKYLISPDGISLQPISHGP
jgi:hypothetical protein